MKETALITGASSGIGYQIALLLAKQKYNLVLTARSFEKLTTLKGLIEQEYNAEVLVIETDLSKGNSAKALYEEIQSKGIKVTALINNAGVGDYGLFAKSNLDKALSMIQLNISSLVSLTHYILKDMQIQNHGKILNIASILAYMPMPRYSVYAATKSFVLSFSEALNTELRPSKITVTSLCPGPTKTNFTADTEMGQSRAYKNMKQVNPRDVAKLGISAMEKGKRTAIYGVNNKFLVFSTRLGTKGLILKIADFISSK